MPSDISDEMSKKLREISVAEFFEKNRHLLGFDNPAKAILTVVKEAVDNSLDACEQARILPEIKITIKEARKNFKILDTNGLEIAQIVLEDGNAELRIGDNIIKPIEKKEGKGDLTYLFSHENINYKFKIIKNEKEENYEFIRGKTELKILKLPQDRYKIIVEDNGPGIAKEHVPRVFGKLLYGSKFAGGMQSRGQQGIGISASLLYSQLTTGKPAKVYSRTSPSKPAYYCEIRIDTTKNEPIILEEKFLKDGFRDHGVTIEMEIEGKMIGGSHSVDEYIYQTTISNPYATIIYEKPDSTKIIFKRTVDNLPPLPKPIKPHPHGVELGVFERMLKLTDSRTISGFLTNEFSRIGSGTADQLCKLANIKSNAKPKELNHIQIERLWKIMQTFNFMKPPTDCLSPIGEENFISGLKRKYKADFYAATTRDPVVYRGNPFQIEVCMAYGGSLPQNENAKILRFANRVPLIYQASSCAITKAIQKIDWRHYNIDVQNNIPFGPLVIAVHMASVWIPYTSESKEAIDPYPAILKEIKLAIQDCARKIQKYISGKRRREEASQRIGLFEKYIPEVARSIAYLADEDERKIKNNLEKLLKKSDIFKNDSENEKSGE